VNAANISGSGQVLLRIVRGPIENVRPHARQRKSGMLSSFFFRAPFLMMCLLLQCGQRSGGLIFERRDGARIASPEGAASFVWQSIWTVRPVRQPGKRRGPRLQPDSWSSLSRESVEIALGNRK
jgi:hypothetical protein